jgi:transposase
MSKQKKKKYSDEFKASSVNLVISSGKTVAQVASDLGMNATTL